MGYTPPEEPHRKPGDRALFFDALAWTRTKDIGNNDVYWRPATIIDTYWIGADKVADIKFDHRDVVSKGHFIGHSYTRPIPS